MHKNHFLIILLIGLITLSLSLKENTLFQMHQQNSEEVEHGHKNHKKTKIIEKEKFELYDFFGSVRDALVQVKQLIRDFFNVFVLRKTKPAQKQQIVYRQNFASQNGGAQILLISSSKIKSPKAILRTDPDAYLFTADVLPITIVIALKEQILIDSFSIQSGEAYSCITNDFILEGAFSLENSEWMLMGNFTAQNSFQNQEFAVEQKTIRYLRLTILSSYGKWKYFTLSQVKVYGQGLFSHAMESLLQTEYNILPNVSSDKTQYKTVQEGNTLDTQKKQHTNKSQGKNIEAKQILVEAFEELVVQGKNDMINKKDRNFSQKKTSENDFLTEDLQIDSYEVVTQKSFSKDKKSISILRKKITYLQKRNYELNQELKNLKKMVEEEFLQLETRHANESDGGNQENEKWFNIFMSSQSMVVISMMINILCLVLVGLVFKQKILPSRMNQSHSMDISQKKDQKVLNEQQKQIQDKKQKSQKRNSNKKKEN